MCRRISMVGFAFVALLNLVACTNGKDADQKASAERTLSEYVSRSFAIKSPEEKSKLIELTTGEVKTALEGLDLASFRQHFIDQKREFRGLKIRDERKVGDDRFSITYELSYTSKSTDSENKITNKKHAVFVYEGGKWLISEVRNIKTYIEHQNEMSF